MRREYLFQYLNDKGISVLPPVTKLTLINKILSIWGESSKEKEEKQSIPESNLTVTSVPTQVNDVNLLAIKFAEWFYHIFNENEPIGEEHFWQDSSLKLNLISEAANLSENVENDPSEIVNLLYKTKCEHGIYFNPNLGSEGVRGKMDSHGLVMVFVCGTIHTKDSCVGVYEQMFALARDPYSENNWKIKHTLLNLKSKSVTSVPMLSDSSLNGDLLQINDK